MKLRHVLVALVFIGLAVLVFLGKSLLDKKGHENQPREAEQEKGAELSKTAPGDEFAPIDLLTASFITDLLELETSEAVSIASELADTLKKNRALVPLVKKTLDKEKYPRIVTQRQWEKLWELEDEYRGSLIRHVEKTNVSLSKPARRLYGELLIALATSSPSAMIRLDVAIAILQLALKGIECDGEDPIADVPLDTAIQTARGALGYLFGAGGTDDEVQIAAKTFIITGTDFFRLYFLALAQSSRETEVGAVERVLRSELDGFLVSVEKAAQVAPSPKTRLVFEELRGQLMKTLPDMCSYVAHEMVTRKQVEKLLRDGIEAINADDTDKVLKMFKGLDKAARDRIMKEKAIFLWTDDDDAASLEFKCVSLPNPIGGGWEKIRLALRAFVITTKPERRLEKFELTLERFNGSWLLVRPH